MSKQDKRTEISYKVYNTICECEDMGQALEVLTDTIAATISGNIKGKTDQVLIMGACIARLREYKKQIQNETLPRNTEI